MFKKTPLRGRFFLHIPFLTNSSLGRMFVIKFFRTTVCVCVSLALAACQGFNPVVDTFANLMPKGAADSAYQPGLEYLQVSLDGRSSAMALGYRQTKGLDVHEHWYSGQREMLHLVNGRVVEVQGMTHELRKQSDKVPNWHDLAESKRPLVWSRSKDLMPGYRYGQVEYIISQWIEPTAQEVALVNQPAQWFIEQVKSKTADGREWLYKEIYAVVNNQVIYSEQCVAPELCVTLRPLGMVKPGVAKP